MATGHIDFKYGSQYASLCHGIYWVPRDKKWKSLISIGCWQTWENSYTINPMPGDIQ